MKKTFGFIVLFLLLSLDQLLSGVILTDLVVSQLDARVLSYWSAYQQSEYLVSYTITNQAKSVGIFGKGVAYATPYIGVQPTIAKFYLSRNGDLHHSKYLGYAHIPALELGESYSNVFKFKVRARPDVLAQYCIIAVADADNRIEENDETNNTTSSCDRYNDNEEDAT